ncbi:hypothetical protein ES706_04312 [subsurface metagenome]
MADLSRFTWGKRGKKGEPGKGDEMKEKGATGNLNSILEEMAEQVDGLLCIAVAGSDGVAISSYVPPGSMLNAELAAAQLATIFRIARTSADKLKAGDLEDNLFTSTAGQILIRPLGQESYLAMVTTRDAPLGIVRLVVKSYASRVEQALGRVS